MKKLTPLHFTALSALLLAFAIPAGDAAAQGKSLKKQLVGTWSIVSATTKAADGSLNWGSNPKGQLIFTANGHYSSQLMRADRPKVASNSRLKTTPEEDRAAAHGTIASFGTYTVDEKKKAFIVRFEASTYPNREGTEQIRPFTIKGDELTIQNPAPSSGGPPSVLTYRRAR